MSTVKISQLTLIPQLNSNTANTLFVGVDVPSGITGKFTATTLGEGLYSYQPLKVGTEDILFPDTTAQFVNSSPQYVQTVLMNQDDGGTADYIVAANNTTDTNYYIDMGFANADFDPGNTPYNSLGTSLDALSGYLYVQGGINGAQPGGNLVIGTTVENTETRFIAGGVDRQHVVAKITEDGFKLQTGYGIIFSDGTTQTTAATPVTYAQAAFNLANTNAQDIVSSNTWLQEQIQNSLVTAKAYTDTANSKNITYTNTVISANLANAKAYTDTANTFLQANTGSALQIAKDYTDTANTFLQANDYTTLSVSKTYTDTTNTNIINIVANTAYSKANTANVTAQAAFDKANTVNGALQVTNTVLTATLSTAESAFDKANNALANTTGTFSGDLTVTGNTIVHNSIRVNNPSMPGNNQYILVTGTANNAIGAPSNPGYTVHTAVDGGNRIAAESYGTGTSVYPGLIGRRGRGTAESPSSVQSGDIILRIGGNAYGATKFSQFADARIEFVSIETHTDSSKGTEIQFWTTSIGSNTATQIGTMNGNTVTFTGSVSPLKGFIFTPNVGGTSLTKTVDFGNDSLIKFDVNDNATITLSNYVAGKVVEVWITNSAAQNKTVTHGCLANNSTAKSTTFTIQSQSCAYLRYFSIDGDNANTFVSIVA